MSNTQQHEASASGAQSPDATSPNDDAAGHPSSSTGKRKRGSANRGVAHLTPEQLERKRANDREAQRAIRERTRNHIDRLNAEIRELKNQQPYQDLQAVLRQKEAVDAENADLKRRVASFVESMQQFLSGPTQKLHELATVAAGGAGPSPPQTHDHLQQNSPYNGDGVTPQPWTPSTTYQPSPSTTIHPYLAGALGTYDERLGVNYLLHGPQPVHRRSIGESSTEHHGAATSPNSTTTTVHTRPTPSQQAWSMLPRLIDPTCALDGLLIEFLRERQRLAAEGASKAILVGPAYPNFNAMLNRNTLKPSHPLSKVMTEITITFPDISNLPEQTAVVYVMFLVMRWQIDPTRENYERVPSWLNPRPSQIFSPHAHWIDYLPWPRLRDALIQGQPSVMFKEDWFVPYTETLCLNWPYKPGDVLLETPAHDSSPGKPSEPFYTLNPAFESHLRKLENWTLGPAWAEAFPQYAPCANVRDSRMQVR